MPQMNENGFYDIYSLWHLPFWQTHAFYYSVLVFVFILVSVICWFLVRWYFKKKIIPKTAWQDALDQLHLLQQTSYHTKKEGKLCYFAMTDIIKTYLIARYDYPLHGKTDKEVIRYLTKKEPTFLAGSLKEIVDGSLHIKFANETALEKKIVQDLEQCCSIVKKTIPEQKSQS